MGNCCDNTHESWKELVDMLRKAVVEKNKEIVILKKHIENLNKFIDRPEMSRKNFFCLVFANFPPI